MKNHILIVEDDPVLARSLIALLNSAGMEKIQHFSSCTDFLDAYPALLEVLHEPGCLLLDIRMPNMTGTELFHQLQAKDWAWPIIFMTGHGDLSMAIELMKAGAFDYLTKPFDPMALIAKIQAAAQLSTARILVQDFKEQHLNKLRSLTPHESQVFLKILNNQTNRDIAEEMQNSMRTIENHRANILKKMAASTALELAQHHERFTLLGGTPPFPKAISKTP